MNLPVGVLHSPRQQSLIAKAQSAIIRIETRHPFSHNDLYKLITLDYRQQVVPYLRGDWDDFDRIFMLDPQSETRIYGRAEHHGETRKPEMLKPKLPGITVVTNLPTKESRGLPSQLMVFGCTMGHSHAPDRDQRTLEVYEFQSHGMLALDREDGKVELWVAQDGDKVAVPNGCHVTSYNLGDKDDPLITLDFSSLATNYFDEKRDLAHKYGPVFLAYYDDFEVVFVLNRLYVNNRDHPAGVRLAGNLKDRRNREIRITRGARLNLGRLLYEQLTQNPELIGRFAQLGIVIKQASPEAALGPLGPGQSSYLYFSRPLVEAAKEGTEVYRYFFPEAERATPTLPKPWAMEKAVQQAQQPVTPLALNRPLMIVVEGAGEWVEQAYRSLFKKKVDENKKLSVFYADDTRWKEARPQWADPERWEDPKGGADHQKWKPEKTGIQDWEVYLDKADPEDFARYRNLRPDLVLIVTPDFTHSTIVRQWLGKAPAVLVEKPFDSQVKNVDDLKYALEEPYNTIILGLDHYQFYALPLYEMQADIRRHLGGALSKVEFYLTEDRPVEQRRARTLQYGLTLDLLPHLFALLTYFGKVHTIDEIQVVEAGQYYPLGEDVARWFRSETYSHVRFTFEDYSGNGFHVPCRAVVGKGFSKEVKYMEVTGRTGNAVRIDLRKPDDTLAAQHPGYPFSCVSFLQGEQVSSRSDRDPERIKLIPDPYHSKRLLRLPLHPTDPTHYCRRLFRERYEVLLDDLLNGTANAVPSTLRLNEGREIVRALDRTWWAIQEKRHWRPYDLGGLDPAQLMMGDHE